MAHSVQKMKEDLYALGVRPGDTLMVHFSYKALGTVENGAAGCLRRILICFPLRQ